MRIKKTEPLKKNLDTNMPARAAKEYPHHLKGQWIVCDDCEPFDVPLCKDCKEVSQPATRCFSSNFRTQ